MRRRPLPLFRLTLFFLVALGILWLSLSAHPYLPSAGVLSWDKAQHALAYAVLALTGGWALQPILGDDLRAWRGGAMLAIAYGILMEVAQMTLTQVRTGQLGDAVANAVGAGAVLCGFFLVSRWREKRKQPEMDR
ncbi:MAG: VanZ family protein [Syntrophotaleaceae bacterium]